MLYTRSLVRVRVCGVPITGIDYWHVTVLHLQLKSVGQVRNPQKEWDSAPKNCATVSLLIILRVILPGQFVRKQWYTVTGRNDRKVSGFVVHDRIVCHLSFPAVGQLDTPGW